MFEIRRNYYQREVPYYCIGSVDIADNYLHSDGRVFNTPEYFPTREAAQAVLDKFQPKPKHEWKHGDVFKTSSGVIMMYHEFTAGRKSEVVCVVGLCGGPSLNMEYSLQDATFLFNIKEKI